LITIILKSLKRPAAASAAAEDPTAARQR